MTSSSRRQESFLVYEVLSIGDPLPPQEDRRRRLTRAPDEPVAVRAMRAELAEKAGLVDKE